MGSNYYVPLSILNFHRGFDPKIIYSTEHTNLFLWLDPLLYVLQCVLYGIIFGNKVFTIVFVDVIHIFKGDAPTPKWLSQGAKNLTKRILCRIHKQGAEIKED